MPVDLLDCKDLSSGRAVTQRLVLARGLDASSEDTTATSTFERAMVVASPACDRLPPSVGSWTIGQVSNCYNGCKVFKATKQIFCLKGCCGHALNALVWVAGLLQTGLPYWLRYSPAGLLCTPTLPRRKQASG